MLITFEGTDGAGKTTQIRMLEAHLRATGREVLVTREPGGTEFGEEVRNILKHAPYGARLSMEAELLLFLAARTQLVNEVIMPALDRGVTVLCDRFTDSSVAYQGAGRGLNERFIREANAFATGGLTPRRTYLLDLPAEVGLARARGRSQAGPADRMEGMEKDFYTRVADCYRRLSATEPDRIRIVDASRAPEAVFADILDDDIFRPKPPVP